MFRIEAEELLRNKIKNEKYIEHSFLVARLMECLAKFLGKDLDKWYITGLLHDLDYEEATMNEHGLISARLLKGKVDDEVIHAIEAHNFENNGIKPENDLDYGLIACDALSGLISASILVMPNKSIEEVKLKTLKKKFKQKDFARNVDRKRILFCEKLGITKEKFFEISLDCLKKQ